MFGMLVEYLHIISFTIGLKTRGSEKDIQFRKSAKEFESKHRPILSDSKSETNDQERVSKLMQRSQTFI